MSQLEIQEKQTGVRFVWNHFPVGAPAKSYPLSLPPMAHLSPLADLDNVPVLNYLPIGCCNCRAVLNPYAMIDFHSYMWTCPICFTPNPMPPEYKEITPNHLPGELQMENTVVEYMPPLAHAPPASLRPPTPPTFIFLLDCALEREEFDAMKTHLLHSISLIPPACSVGLITFGKHVEIHAINSSSSLPISLTFRGDVTTAQLTDRFRDDVLNYIAPLSLCELQLCDTLNSLEPDIWVAQTPVSFRPARALGVALHTALLAITAFNTSLLAAADAGPFPRDKSQPMCFPRIVLFIGGVPTVGPGASALLYRGSHIRSHTDLLNNTEAQTLFQTSSEFYHRIAFKCLYGMTVPIPAELASHLALYGAKYDKRRAQQPAPTVLTNPEILDCAVPKVTCDVFACGLDQVGLAEISALLQPTGGRLVLDDSFTHGVFRGSIRSYFSTIADPFTSPESVNSSESSPQQNNDESASLMFPFGSNCTLNAHCSALLQPAFAVVNGTALPPRPPFKSSAPNASPTIETFLNAATPQLPSDQSLNQSLSAGLSHIARAQPFTNRWFIPTITPQTSLLIVFQPHVGTIDPVLLQKNDRNSNSTPLRAVFQFSVKYFDGLGRLVIRIITLARSAWYCHKLPQPQIFRECAAGFDQEAAIAAVTKLATHSTRMLIQHPLDTVKWLDAWLLFTGKLFLSLQDHAAVSPNAVILPQDAELLPQFIFYLRRSQLFDIFNTSVDETLFFRYTTVSQSVSQTLLVIQPQLIQYSVDGPPQVVPLNLQALDSKNIVFLDTFFHVVVWYGQTLAQWKERRLHEQDEFRYLGDLFRAPLTEAKQRLSARFPTPRYIECVEGGSQSRFLLAKLNPPGVNPVVAAGAAANAKTGAKATIQNITGTSDSEAHIQTFSEAQSLQQYMQQFRKFYTTAPKK